MKSNYLTNILLICLVIGLYWFNNQEINDSSQQQLTTLDPNNIQYITVSRPNSTDVTLEKADANWQITQPFQAKANTTRVKLLLSLLNTHSYAQSANNSSLQQFGLSSDSVQLILNEQRFQFGDIESMSKHRYILHKNVLHLVEDKVMPLLNASASSFIENRLFAQKSHIQKISLPLRNDDNSLSAQTLTIEKTDGHWRSKSTKHTADQLSELIGSWQHSHALQVVPVTQSMHRDAVPVIITIQLKEQMKSRKFELQLNDNALYLIDLEQNLRYQFSKAMAKLLLPTHNKTP